MRLFEAIIDANHRAVAGDPNAGLHPVEFASELPMVALTCIDPRLNSLLPSVLGVPPEGFIWLRNAGNIVSGPLSSTMRSLALACAVKGAKEIAIIGHTDCQVSKTSSMELIDRLRAIGVERHALPDDLTDYFGLFSSPRQNVLKAAEVVRSSPLIGPKFPVHGLLVDVETGKVEWLVNGYETLGAPSVSGWNAVVRSAGDTVDALRALTDFKIGEMKFPETKIGEFATKAENWAAEQLRSLESPPAPASPPASPPAAPPKLPLPPPLRPRIFLKRGGK